MTMLRRFVISAGAIALLSAAQAADIIVESRPKGQNHDGYKETAGKWLDSNTPAETAKSGAPGLTPQGQIGSRKTTVAAQPTGDKTKVISAARFTPKIDAPGDYHVYITYPRAANATPVTFVIKTAKGEEKKDLSQNGWGGSADGVANEWIELGTYPFTAGGDQYVELQVTGATGPIDPANPPQAYADAVRFSTEPVQTAQAATAAAAPKAATAAVTKPTAAAAPDSGPITWLDSLAAGRSAAQAQNKKLLVFFMSPQAARSSEYEQKVLNDPRVKGVIKAGFVAVKINMDVERDLASQLQVFRAGTVNVYDSATGNGLEQISDTPGVDELVQRLNAVK